MSQFPKPGRIACCVPFCRRTAKDDGGNEEVLCGNHWKLADRRLTRRYKRFFRYLAKVTELPPETYSARCQFRIGRRLNLLNRMWADIKRQAIERAMGISA